MYPVSITGVSKRALDWLDGVQITSVKEASQIAKALCLRGRDAGKAIGWLEHTRSVDYWESGNPVWDTAPIYDSGTPGFYSVAGTRDRLVAFPLAGLRVGSGV